MRALLEGDAMEIKQLRYFLEAYRLQSFSEAARHCYITPQGLHVSMSRLEEEIGSKLFIKVGNGLVLTPAGEYLLPKARDIVRLCGEITDHFSHEAEKEAIVSVLFTRGTVELIAMPSISDFKKSKPDVEVNLRVEQDYDCMQAVLNGEADMAVCAGPVFSKELSKKHLFTRKNVLVINKQDPLAARDSVSIEDLNGMHLALPREKVSIRNTVLELCREKGFEPNFIENDEPRTAFNCAEIGLQAGIVNEISARKLLRGYQNVSIVPFREHKMDWEIFLIKRNDLQQSKLAKAYENCLLQTAKKVLDLR